MRKLRPDGQSTNISHAAMTKLPKTKAKSIGVSNHTIEHVRKLQLFKNRGVYTNYYAARGDHQRYLGSPGS